VCRYTTDNAELVAEEIRFQFGLVRRCDARLGPPYPGPEQNSWYCVRFIDHERFGLDHEAEDGTTW
jgi:hypothetical protein